jgi:dipeptidyl aminopeptidase/acylaminoacyl peptidase
MATTVEGPDVETRAKSASTARPFKPKDLLRQVVIQGLAVAPDGSSIVYVRRTIEDNKYVRSLWRTTFAGGRPEQLTTGKGTNTRPRFSPDGRSLLFLSDRSGKSQAWVIQMAGGEARQVTDLPNGVGGAEWAPDGKRILLLAPSGEKRFVVGKDDDPVARRIRDYTWRIDGGGYRDEYTSLWVVDLSGGKPVRLTAPTYDVNAAQWSPDGRTIAFVADLRDDAHLVEYPSLWAIPASGPNGVEPAKVAALAGAILNVAWAPSRQIAFLGNSRPKAPGWANVDLYLADGNDSIQLATGRDLNIWNTTYGDFEDAEQFGAPPIAWLDDEHVACLVARRGASHPYLFGVDGSIEAMAEEDMVCSSIDTGGGRVAVVASGHGPSDVYSVENGKLRRLTTDGSKWFVPFQRRVETLNIPHPDGHGIHAWLLPANGERKLGPLVVGVHGGPNLSYGPTPWLELNALADAGFHVLTCNPRGSTGYGEAYARAIEGHWGDKDASDVIRIVEWAVGEGLAERDRIGVFGLSYGGYMTTWLLGAHPGVFAAAVSENPATDLLGMTASSDFGLLIGRGAAGVDHPSEHLEELLDRSPISRIHRNHAPLLLLHAEQDHRCPPGQSELVFTILRSLGREVEMVRYPDEFHLLLMVGRPDRRVDRLERIVGWFEKHLKT